MNGHWRRHNRGKRIRVRSMVPKMWKLAFVVCLLAPVTMAEWSALAPPKPTDYTAVIFVKEKPICAGGIVKVTEDVMVVVTAAHCVYRRSPTEIYVSVGSAEYNSESKRVSYAFVHPYYAPPSIDYDIAVLKIKSPIRSPIYDYPTEEPTTTSEVPTTTPPEVPSHLELSKTEPPLNAELVLSSWNSTTTNKTCHGAPAAMEARKSCKEKMANQVKVSGRMICVNSNENFVPEGSPVIFGNSLAGVVSYGGKLDRKSLRVCSSVSNSEILSFVEKHIL